MLKSGKLKDPHHDAAAADVLAAFEAAQGGGLPTVECYHAAVGAWRRAHPDHTATYAAQQAVRIVLDIKTSLADRGSVRAHHDDARQLIRPRPVKPRRRQREGT